MAAAMIAPLGTSGCGSSDRGHRAGSGGASPDASTGAGGASAAGGPAGNAGTAAGGGSERDAGPGDGATEGGVADAGPACPAPPRAPDAEFDNGATCSAPATCGGALAGTFVLKSLCTTALFGGVRSVCSTAQIDVSDQTASGGIAFDGSTISMSVHAQQTATVTFPNDCSFCQCASLEAELGGAGLDASCSPVCNGGTCTCTVRDVVDLEGSHPYTVKGNTVTTDPNLSFDYCVDSGTLSLTDSSSRSGFASTFVPGTPPPEICDGYDNDLDGVVDDNPVECPTCSHTGVCAEGFTATCGGSQGWVCSYTSPKYEATEQSCDGLDNDCNGVVDKLSTCEVCDGLDNDGDGVVDDHLTDTPVCPKTGVCASGTTAACAGKDGWQCKGSAAGYELVETRCDGLDNDCDGVVDEACPPCSGMKDMWVAGDTGTLDLYRGSPTAASGKKVLSTTGRASELAVDTPASKVYWVNAGIVPNAIQRANFDGSGLETLAATAGTTKNPGIGGMALDPGQSIYWFAQGAGISRVPVASANTAGAGQVIVTGVAASEIAVAGGKLYYSDALSPPSLHRSDLDGKNDQVIVPFPVDQFVVDLVGNHLYWLRWFDFASLDVWRTNLDGTGQQLAASGTQFVDDFNLADFAVDPWQKTVLVASSDYVQYVPDGTTATRATLLSWTSNTGAMALGGCAP